MGAQKYSPKASPKKKSTTLQNLFDLESNPNTTPTLIIAMAHDSETDDLLSIISYCTFIFTFTDPSESPYQQDLKRLKLTQLLTALKSSKPSFTDDRILSPLFSMLSTNLFRPLPPPSNPIPTIEFPLLDDDTDPTLLSPSPSWPHLHIIYDILLKLVLNYDPKMLRAHIDHSFLINLLSLFETEDRRERESLKNVYHRIYSKFTFHRSFMRKAMKDVFLSYVFEMDRHSGIGELLEIWGSIINGFSVPLKEEHKVFLVRVLLPMHKPKGMQVYHRQLAYCVSQFVQKEPMLGAVVVGGILRLWPVTNCQKEVLLIGEVEELVEYTDQGLFGKLAFPLCAQIAKCLNSWNSQVAERALYVWNNEHFVRMASEAIEKVLPIVVEAIEKNIKSHWSKTVRQLTISVKTMLEEMEPRMYAKCVQELDQREAMANEEEMKRKEKWRILEMAAANNQLQEHTQCIYVSN
ncbi:serine/threonine protein phosphatase 2A 57 kDa regulatory subunit B' alpha isoform-like [Magnolia sinica]|uniref:serine/threonine protein phosphatase 2A 57 kDa regulatory subunit B' alpha isoform-like n=1 Tax=Magnolia sinica TaxID=86752 RepID=UPI002657ECC1|nr:serine/threonine protein phosphatase 2A 57 kDa regulatory subunit B' alpha isoform-like [Magnolia sinica]